MSRRTFLGATSLSIGGFQLLATDYVDDSAEPSGFIDVNMNLSHWPFRRLPSDNLQNWLRWIRAHGVKQGWVGSFDGLLHKNMSSVNAHLFELCKRQDGNSLLPFGSINPMLPDWEEDLRRCIEEFHMPGIRLHPNYHGYTLENPAFIRLLQLAKERSLIVQLTLLMEDERMMHPRLRVPPVDPKPLLKVVPSIPGLRLILLNALSTLRGDTLYQLLKSGEVYVEISMLEGVGGLDNILKTVPINRILFGSHAPYFYFESAALKLKESFITMDQKTAICISNAKTILKKSHPQS